MKFKYTNTSKVMQHLEFASGGQFLFKGQQVTLDEKAVSVPDGVLEETLKSTRSRKSDADKNSE